MRHAKRESAGKITRAAAILLFLIAVMLVILAVPAGRSLLRTMRRIGCQDAMATANRVLREQYLLIGEEDLKAETAQEIITHAMLGWDDLCPDGGKPFLAEPECRKSFCQPYRGRP